MDFMRLSNSSLPRKFSIPLGSTSRRAFLGLSGSALLLTTGLGLAQPAFAQNRPVKLTLVSYAVTKSAYERIIPKFVALYKKQTGQTVEFQQSYGGSGSQTRAVIDGLNADVVHLALGADVDQLQSAGLVKPGWEKRAPNNAIVQRSVIAFITRDGNPKKITKWTDLIKPGIKVITANPKTSGGARWNFLGLWSSVLQTGGNDAKARQFVAQVLKNAPILPKDAREATDVFVKQGQGDVLLNYENEVLLAQSKGEKVDFTIPSVNFSIDTPVAVVDRNVDRNGSRKAAEAFVKYLFTPEAQTEYAKAFFRPVNPTVAKQFSKQFPAVTNLSNINKFGGWDVAQKKFFANNGLFDQILLANRR
ncbi:sulfate ABC transporter substrate-binding protein [Pseudocalidococcus azoricus]|uniref:sulfate ABC transporter substrate-binding protein n=1 Tax=Pseudocalidococcus azoricus TaxID=3110322 RepID=UPI00389A0406